MRHVATQTPARRAAGVRALARRRRIRAPRARGASSDVDSRPGDTRARRAAPPPRRAPSRCRAHRAGRSRLECVDQQRLARRRRRARTRMMASFAKVDLDRLQNRLYRLAAQLKGRRGGSGERAAGPRSSRWPRDTRRPAPDAAAGTIAADRADQGAARVARPGADRRGARDQLCRHPHRGRLARTRRKRCTRCASRPRSSRYQLEIVVPYLGSGGEDAVKRLRAMQDKLGDFHDDTVLDDTLRAAAIGRASERDRPLLASELRAFRKARRRALLRDERAVRAAIVKLRGRRLRRPGTRGARRRGRRRGPRRGARGRSGRERGDRAGSVPARRPQLRTRRPSSGPSRSPRRPRPRLPRPVYRRRD